MKKLDVEHFLGIYQLRQKMQENGVTNPSEEVKKFTKEFVEKLLKLPMNEEIKIKNYSFFDSSENLIAQLPIKEHKESKQEKMNQNFDFQKASMPETRKADYYLCCLNGSVFIDFNSSNKNEISLVRISFDGFGCCSLNKKAKKLNMKGSQKFIQEMKQSELNQESITELVKKAIRINKKFIWSDALERYKLIE